MSDQYKLRLITHEASYRASPFVLQGQARGEMGLKAV
jgi:hypothetical protein